MWQNFKQFIGQGNVLNTAVGIVMGAAFTNIVKSLVSDLITPLIGILIGGIDLSHYTVKICGASFGVGSFINAVITFLIVALVLFFLVKAAARIRPTEKEEKAKPEPSREEVLLTEIRDLLKEQKNEA